MSSRISSGHLAADPIERVQRVGRLVLLEVDPREPVRRVVPHRVVHVGLEHGLDRATGAVVHAIVELEVADRELRALDVVLERVERRARRRRSGPRSRRRGARAPRSSGPDRRGRATLRNRDRADPRHGRARGHEHRGAERNRSGQRFRQDGLPAPSWMLASPASASVIPTSFGSTFLRTRSSGCA